MSDHSTRRGTAGPARSAPEPRVARALEARRRRLASAPAPYAPPSLEEVRARLDRLLTARWPQAGPTLALDFLTGGASKQHFAFEVEERTAAGPRRRALVLRTALAESLGTAPDFQREFEVQSALRGVVPVPEALCVDADGEIFGAPAIVLERVPGVTVPPEAAGKPSGFGACFPPARRAVLGPEFVETLARIHGFADAPGSSALAAFERPCAGTTEAAERAIAWWRAVWDDDALEPHPMVEVALDWLAENAPVADRIAVVHGDYRSGNFLFDPATNRLTAILDWEMVHFGDRHEDLGWLLARIYVGREEDGTEYACGLVPRDELLRRYEALSGSPVDPERLFFYEVLNEVKIAVIALATGPRNALERQSQAHLSNVVFAGAGHRCLARLHELLAPRLRGEKP